MYAYASHQACFLVLLIEEQGFFTYHVYPVRKKFQYLNSFLFFGSIPQQISLNPFPYTIFWLICSTHEMASDRTANVCAQE